MPRCAARSAERTDLSRSRTEIQINDTNVALSKSQTLPDLRVQANYLGNGAGGTRLLREGGFPGTVVGAAEHELRQRARSGVQRATSRHGRSA